MKKVLLFALMVLSVNSYSNIERSNNVSNRGLELMRESSINQNMGLSKQSGSTQIIDAYRGNSKYERTKGFMIGTSSNFVDYPNVSAGVTIAYDKYNQKNSDEKYWGRNYDLHTYFSYKLDKNLFLAGVGYSQARHVEKREYSGNVEYGRFLTPNTYAYLGIEGENRIYKGKKSVENFKFANYKLGINRQDTWKKLKFYNGIEVNMDNKIYDKEDREKYNLELVSRVSYYIYDDLLIDLQYRGIKNKKFYESIIGLGFTHNF